MGKDKNRPAEVFTAADLVFAGRRLINDGHLVCQIHLLCDGQLQEPRLFLPELLADKVIGGIYTGASFTSNLASGLEQIRYIGRWDDELTRIDWRARDEAVERCLRLRQEEDNARHHHEIEALLLPLRELYQRYAEAGDPAAQEALEASVLRALRRPVRKRED